MKIIDLKKYYYEYKKIYLENKGGTNSQQMLTADDRESIKSELNNIKNKIQDYNNKYFYQHYF